MRTIPIALAAASLVAAMAAPALATRPTDPDVVGDGHRVTICHATSSNNPDHYWNEISVDIASSGGLTKLMGHREHALGEPNNRGRTDVIPAFTYDGVGYGPYGDDDQEGLPEACQGEVYQDN